MENLMYLDYELQGRGAFLNKVQARSGGVPLSTAPRKYYQRRHVQLINRK